MSIKGGNTQLVMWLLVLRPFSDTERDGTHYWMNSLNNTLNIPYVNHQMKSYDGWANQTDGRKVREGKETGKDFSITGLTTRREANLAGQLDSHSGVLSVEGTCIPADDYYISNS